MRCAARYWQFFIRPKRWQTVLLADIIAYAYRICVVDADMGIVPFIEAFQANSVIAVPNRSADAVDLALASIADRLRIQTQVYGSGHIASFAASRRCLRSVSI